jgi:hypothetical protein
MTVEDMQIEAIIPFIKKGHYMHINCHLELKEI